MTAGGGGGAGPAREMVTARGVSRTFGSGHTAVEALREVSFTVRRGHLVAVCGRSGSGKTTLLNMVGGLDTPTSGDLQVAGHWVTAMPERDRLALRRSTVAFIFQSFGLIPVLTAAENVGVPLRIAGTPARAREERSRRCWPSWGSQSTPRTARMSCPAASSSGSRSPGRWPGGRNC